MFICLYAKAIHFSLVLLGYKFLKSNKISVRRARNQFGLFENCFNQIAKQF